MVKLLTQSLARVSDAGRIVRFLAARGGECGSRGAVWHGELGISGGMPRLKTLNRKIVKCLFVRERFLLLF